MLKRVIYAAIGVVGLVLIGLATASATVWRADDVLRASATPDEPILITDPGVLEMAGDPVTVTATVPSGGHVALAIGRDTDVTGWVGTDDHARVTGLAGWHQLALAGPAPVATTPAPTPSPTGTVTASATPTPTPAPTPSPTATAAAGAPGGSAAAGAPPDPSTSDMWVTQQEGAGSATLTWQAQPGRWSLLVVGTTASGAAMAPTLELAWPRTVTTPYLVPGTVLGSVLFLLGTGLLAYDIYRKRHPRQWTPVLTASIPVVADAKATAGQPLTRRQIREMQALAAQQHAEPKPAPAPAPAPVPEGPASAGATRSLSPAASVAGDSAAAGAAAAAASSGPAVGVAGAGAPGAGVGSAAAHPEGGATAPLTRRALRGQRPAWATGQPPATQSAAGASPHDDAATQRVPAVPAEPTAAAEPPAAAEPAAAAGPAAGDGPATQVVPAVAATPAGRSSSTWPSTTWPTRADVAAPAVASPSAPARPEAPEAQGGVDSSAPAGERQPSWLRRLRPSAAPEPATPPPPAEPAATTPPAEPASAGEPTEPGAGDASRADAWRRAWGLPPLDVEDEEEQK